VETPPSPAEIHKLFANSNPDEVWDRAVDIVRRISPAYDFSRALTVYTDVVRLFRGEYPGYGAIGTLYHDLRHTLDVFLCGVRLMHGVHLSGNRLDDRELTLIMMAALMHDIGYAQRRGEEAGTGAQHTLEHVERGIRFLRDYLSSRDFPPDYLLVLEPMLHSTNPSLSFATIPFPDARTRLLAQIVATADMVGQMADRSYLEKLLFLCQEFKEAKFGNYQSLHDLLCQTKSFYELTRHKRLDGAYEKIYEKLSCHFKDYMGVENNFYLESIEKNIAYLEKVISLDEAEYISMLKRSCATDES
jgi:hypothetical protein